MAKVSRQAVHRWWVSKKKNVDILSRTQRCLADSLGVSMETLSKDLPIVSDESKRKKFETQLLWDQLYPDLESFTRGLVVGQSEALARLVQVYGLFAAQKIAGQQVWKKFPQYKNKIHPGRRKGLEVIWNEIQNPASN